MEGGNWVEEGMGRRPGARRIRCRKSRGDRAEISVCGGKGISRMCQRHQMWGVVAWCLHGEGPSRVLLALCLSVGHPLPSLHRRHIQQSHGGVVCFTTPFTAGWFPLIPVRDACSLQHRSLLHGNHFNSLQLRA